MMRPSVSGGEYVMEEKRTKQALKISVMGDSVSTYEGWNPYGYAVYYKDDVAYENEIKSVDDTWWMQVIHSVGGELCVNNSFSGSFVSDKSLASACSEARCSSLDRGDQPDVILVYMGMNDRGYRVEIGIDKPDDPQYFYGGYRTMLRRLKSNYPRSKIICATLPNAYKRGYETVPTASEQCNAAERYNEAIRQAVREENCYLADVALPCERYETLDYGHPTAQGHRTLAKLWLECLNDFL